MTDSGLPSDATVALRQAEYERQQKDRDERVARVAHAFTKLPYSDSEGGEDMAETLTAIFTKSAAAYPTAEFTLDDLEAISRRIAELNQMVMQGGLVLDEAAIRREAAEVEAAEREATLAAQGVAQGTVAREAAVIAREAADAASSGYAERTRAAVEARKKVTAKTPDSPL